MVSGGLSTTGLIGSPTLGCCVVKIATGLQAVSLGYNQLPPSINVLNGANYDTYVRTKGAVGWVAIDPSVYPRCTTGDLGLRIIRGNVSANSTITQGSGFTISKSGTGYYNINFTTAFTVIPTATFTPYGASQYAGLQNLTLTFVQISINSSAGVLIDQGFSFIIIGTN